MTVTIANSNFLPASQPAPSWQPRPWGASQALMRHDRFKVRHLVISPGGTLRLRSHLHHAGHWLVVSGSGRVTIEDETTELFESQSIDIAIGLRHRIENHGKVDLHLIEVQSGAYLGEDDICFHPIQQPG